MENQFYFNQAGYNADISFMNNKAIPVIENVVSKFLSLGIPCSLNTDDHLSMVNTPEIFLYDKLTNESSPNIGGVKIDKLKAFDLLEKPVGYEPFIKSAVECISELQNLNIHHPRPDLIALGNFEISENHVKLSGAITEMLEKRYSYRLKNEKQEKHFTSLKQLAESLNDVIGLYPALPIEDIISRSLIGKREDFKVVNFTVNPDHIVNI